MRNELKFTFFSLFLCLFIFLGIKITFNNEIFKSSIETSYAINKYFRLLEEKYIDIKFDISENNDAIFIAIPVTYETNSSGERSLTDIAEEF